jgi:hypothetical protein
MTSDDDTPSTVANVLRSLDVVLFELTQIDQLWLGEPRDVINTSTIHEARRRTRLLIVAAESYLQWVADTRLHPPTN